jgi:hypothetical protein
MPQQPEAWLSAGYFLVVPGTRPPDLSDLMPERLITVSDCISDVHPHGNVLLRGQDPYESKFALPSEYGSNVEELVSMRAWMDRALEVGDLGWPNVFLNVRAAREFRRQFTGATRETRLLGLGLTPEVAAEYVKQEGIEGEDAGDRGYALLRDAVPLDPSGSCLGFDVLGAEGWGSYHTFACNALTRPYREHLGIVVNAYGLIDDYEQAVEACSYTLRDDVGAEPVAWYPFRVDEYPV